MELEMVISALKARRGGQVVASFESQFSNLQAILSFLTIGGDIPAGLKLPREHGVAFNFSSEITRLVGGFLVTKNICGPPRPRRAVYVIKGSLGHGRVALKKLASLGQCAELNVKKLAIADPDDPGGWVADVVRAQ